MNPAVKSPSDTRPPPFLVGDHLALDFLNTTAAPKGKPVEWLATGADLIDWLVAANVVTACQAAELAEKWPQHAFDDVAAEARTLREWFRDVVTRIEAHGRGALTVSDVERLNALLPLDAKVRRIELGDGGEPFRVRNRRIINGPRDILGPVVGAMADLLEDGDFSLIRQCENPPCTLWFYDRTKGHRRRWCSPAVCGNRAKVAAFRLRKRLGKKQCLPDSS